jgi:hypothetical protein
LIIELGGTCTEGVHNSDFGDNKIILGVVKFYQVVSYSIGHEVWAVRMMVCGTNWKGQPLFLNISCNHVELVVL